jgi:hypothetical protein
MNLSFSAIVTMAVCIAACIVVVMMTLGAMGASSAIRSAGLFLACGAGLLLGQYVHKTYVAK